MRTFIRHSAEQKNEQRQRQTDNILHKTTQKLRKSTQNYTLTQTFHSTLREKRIIYTLIYVKKFNGKVKFIAQCTESIFTHKNRQHIETTELSLLYASLRDFNCILYNNI